MIKLVTDTINEKDIQGLIKWLEGGPKLTKGDQTIEFEKKISQFLKVKHCVFVNSGSSANLLMLYSLEVLGLLKNKKIVIPSLSWLTDVSPAIQLKYKPILCDCNLNDLSVDLEHLEKIFNKERPAVLLLVSVLGLVPDMDSIVSLCEKYDVKLIEDNCESFGSVYKGKFLGSFGLMSSFSTYYGHHFSTIEGGLITTDSDFIYNNLLMLRSHGWARDLSYELRQLYKHTYGIDDFKELYTFYYPGFNFRSTDLQATIGLHQVEKLPYIVLKRNENFFKIWSSIKPGLWKPELKKDCFVSNFAYPVISIHRDQIVKEFHENEIEIRPLIAGSMGTQPFWKNIYGEQKFNNDTIVNEKGFYIPNHPDLTDADIELMVSIINKY